MVSLKKFFFLCAVASVASVAHAVTANAANPSSALRYATDAYPGFDIEENIVSSGKKTPRWFAWLNGPKMPTPAKQLAWANQCVASGDWSAARRGFDALVREWPASAEAARAQESLAKIYFEHDEDYESACAEYKYLLDYYSSECDYDAMVSRLYDVAKKMRELGKKFLLFRFANTVDVRRAHEAVILRAPGAAYAPQVMLAIAELREEAGEYEQAIQVYENLRNVYAQSAEAKRALLCEARARMRVLRNHVYNRSRCLDTVAFLKLAMQNEVDSDAREEEKKYLDEAVALLEDEAYAAAKFYDSRTRTRRSAIAAYEKFLSTYPASRHAQEAHARLQELQKEGAK